MNALQEEITQKTLALCVEASKMTAQLLQQAIKKVLADMEKHKKNPQLRHGKQTLRQLMKHKGSMGTTSAALCMILVMLPFFLFALYEKNGQTLEVILGHLIQCKFIRPKRRIYQTNNAYSALVRQAKLEKEVRAIAEKSGKTGKRAARRKA